MRIERLLALFFNIALNVGGMQIFFAGPFVRNVFGFFVKKLFVKTPDDVRNAA